MERRRWLFDLRICMHEHPALNERLLRAFMMPVYHGNIAISGPQIYKVKWLEVWLALPGLTAIYAQIQSIALLTEHSSSE